MQQQSLAEHRTAAAAPKRKRRTKRPVEARPSPPCSAPEERVAATPAEERDDGFVVVRRGKIAASFSPNLKAVNVFDALDKAGESTLGIDEEVAAGTMMEDDEWTE